MSKRALILWVCFGTLLLSAATVTTEFRPATTESPSLLSGVEASAEKPVGPTKFKLLGAAYGPSQPAVERPSVARSTLKESTLWLARAIYSETKLPHEQELVAWVIRNRVETGYRGRTTYEEVILDPYQFSAFNPGSSKRSFYMSLTPNVQLPTWQQALWIAHYVRHADPVYRPFSIETRHFYSERSMTGRRHPYWVNRQQFVQPGWDYQVNERRFRFYEEIS
jgi:hypothetical protein